MMKFICPKCGSSNVDVTVKLSNPPTHCYKCNNCSYYSEQRETVIETVFPITQHRADEINKIKQEPYSTEMQ